MALLNNLHMDKTETVNLYKPEFALLQARVLQHRMLCQHMAKISDVNGSGSLWVYGRVDLVPIKSR